MDGEIRSRGIMLRDGDKGGGEGKDGEWRSLNADVEQSNSLSFSHTCALMKIFYPLECLGTNNAQLISCVKV